MQMALVGYELEKEKIEEKIRQIQAQLGHRRATAASGPAPAKSAGSGKRVLSEAARKRIAMAQKKRWAEHRKKAALARKAGK